MNKDEIRRFEAKTPEASCGSRLVTPAPPVRGQPDCVLQHFRDEGYRYCYNNWISPNLSASRLWPRFGFKEASYRLARHINPMIAWTR